MVLLVGEQTLFERGDAAGGGHGGAVGRRRGRRRGDRRADQVAVAHAGDRARAGRR